MKLHNFSEEHIDKDLTSCKKEFNNALLFNCKFKNLQNVVMKNCYLNKSEILSNSLRELLNFTITLSCFSFRNVKLSELSFDLILILLSITSGNDVKRKKLLNILGEDRAKTLLEEIETLE